MESIAGDKPTVPENFETLSPGTSIRLIIASAVRLMREGLAASLHGRDGVAVLDAVDLGPRGIARISEAEPDVVLVDVGETDIAAAVRLVRAASPGAKLVAFGLDETVDRVFACAAAGFYSYIPREFGADELHRALIDAMEGRMICAPHIAAAMFSRLAGPLQELGPRGPPPPLTSRESQILALVAQGRSNKEIARRLTISSATVKNHMHSILQKLRVSRRGQAVARLGTYRGI